MKQKKEDRIYFNRGVPAEESLPFSDIAEVFSNLPREQRNDLLRYGDSGGYQPLRETLAGFYPNTAEEQLFVANGSLQILDLLANHYFDAGDLVLVEKPTYDRALTIFRRAGLNLAGVEMEQDGINVDRLTRIVEERNPRALYTISDFQNPTGSTTSRSKRERLAELAASADFEIIEDSPYRRLRYRGEDVPSVRSFNSEVVLRISSFSKLVCPGIRVGWLVGDPEVTRELANYAEATYISPNQLSQGIVQWLISNGWLEERIEELKELYSPRLQTTLDSLARFFPESEWIEAEGGFFVGLWLPEPGKSEKFYQRGEERGLVFSSPAGFFPEEGGQGFVRLPFPALTQAELEEGVRRAAEIYHEI